MIKDERGFENLYLPDAQRIRTDSVCTVLGAAFAIMMFVVACIFWNPDNFKKRYSFSNGANIQNLCYNSSMVIIYDNPKNLSEFRCLFNCPVMYTTYKQLCIPIQDEKRQKLMANSDISLGLFGNQFKWVLLYAFITTLGLGLMRLCYINLFPRLSVTIDFYLCIITLIGIGVLLLVLVDQFWREVVVLKILVAVICFFIAFFIFILICMYSNEIKIYGIFIDYAVKGLARNLKTYIYIPLFLLFTAGLVALILWQHSCYISRMGSSKVFYNLNNQGIWGILNILQFIWGVQFLRDAFNYCVSGNMINWYWRQSKNQQQQFQDQPKQMHPFRRLLCLNWGSVVGGSFYNAFFQIPTIIFELLRCHPKTFCSKAGRFCYKNCGCLYQCFDLVRSDTYSYINITSQAYCQSSAQCRRLCEKSELFVGVHSPMKHYRLICHVLCISMLFLVTWFFLRARMEFYGIWNYTILIIVIFITITWFISIFSDAAEAFQTSFLVEKEFETEYDKMYRLEQPYRSDLEHRERRIKKDGNC